MKSKLLFLINKIHPIIWQSASLMISIAFFSLILVNRSPNILRPLSVSLRTGFGLIIPVTAALVYIAFRIPGRLGDLFGITFTLSIFAMPLAGLWASGLSQSTVLSGLIPLFDAETYYIDAMGLVNGERFSIFSARRPLFSGLLSVLLSITNNNLMAALAVLTFVAGLSCYIAAREIQRSHGAEAAIFVLMVLFLFYRAHSGISMSENLGVAFGSLGFGLLWRGASNKSVGYIWLGLLLTTLALNARAGAFFILPLIILWAGRLFRENKIISWKAFFISSSAVILGFTLSLSLTRLIAVPSGVPFANFSYSLYGLASGGKSWYYVFESHPEILAIQEPEQSARIYQMAFDLIRQKPWQTVQGALFNWKMLFSDSWYSMYSYIGGENWKVLMLAQWGMYVLCILGLSACLIDHKDPVKGLVLVSAIGLFISVPFLPPTDAYRMRPYAASIVICGALPALGFDFLLRHSLSKRPSSPNTSSMHPRFIAIFSLGLVCVTWLGPIIIKANAVDKIITPLVACPPNSNMVQVKYYKGSFINIYKQNQYFLDWMPNYHIALFQENAHSMADLSLIAWAESIEAPKTIFLTWDYNSKGKALVVIRPNLLPDTGALMQMCGKFETDKFLQSYKIFYADSVQILRP